MYYNPDVWSNRRGYRGAMQRKDGSLVWGLDAGWFEAERVPRRAAYYHQFMLTILRRKGLAPRSDLVNERGLSGGTRRE